MTDTEAETNGTAGEKPPRSRSRRIGRWVLWIFGPAVVLVGCVWYVFTVGRYEATDNAYLHADVITIAPEVAGRVVEVAVRENQHVRAGDLLFRIDPEPYQLAVNELEAQAIAIGEYLNSSRDSYAAALADLEARRADVKHEEQLYRRVEDLRAKGLVSQENLDDASNSVATARADRDAAEAMAAKEKTLLGGDADAPVQQQAGYRVIEARLAKAQLELDHTVVRASVDGIIGKQTLQAGDFLNTGQAAMPLVAEDVWVNANFKETDMTWVRPGQRATVSVDAYPGREWQAEVASVSPASSAMFSVLPAENATGNWVKVVQRIPVRLHILHPESDGPVLRAGMSAEVKIDTGSGHTLADRWFGRDPEASQLASEEPQR